MPTFNLYRKMLTILVVMLIPIIVLYVYSNKTSSDVLREELQNSSRDQLNFFQQQIDTTIHSISQWPNLLIYDPDISNLKDIHQLEGDYLDLETIELIKRIQKKLSIQENSVNWASQLTIYSPSLKRVITSSKVYQLDEAYLSSLSTSGWQMNSFTISEEEREHQFSLVTVSPFSSSSSPQLSNLVLEVQFSSGNIKQMLDAFRGDGQRNPFYYVKEGEIIYHSAADKELVTKLVDHLKLQSLEKSSYEVVTLEGETYLVNMERSTTTGWILVDYLPISEVMLPITKSNKLFYASVATLLLMAAVVVYILYVQVQVPIKQLITSFQRVKKEDYSVRLQPRGNTEFTFLFNRFNSMVTQIQELFQRSYLEQIHIREAKLKQLQSQINPHFFYNCFSFISSMAKLQNYGAVIAMAQNLSHYYRYTTRQEKELVTLQEEMTFVQHYLDISVMRMKRLTYHIELPDELLLEMIPPLSIQPLVENAVLHGIERSSSASTIAISVRRDKSKVIVTVEDDGKGMDEADIVALTKRLNYPMQEDMGCGLWNVHQRMTLRYGDKAGITIQSSKLGGLSVSISWHVNDKQRTEGEQAMVDILLVDDETYVTESLALTIPWHELGVNGVYQAASAAEALDVMETQHIDILVTDIRMPEQSGLELIEQAKEKWPRLKTVLLTGYSDFEYAQRAIKLQARDYLLKPVDDDAFVRCISTQVKVLKQERKRMEEERSQQYARKSEQAVLRKQLMQELLLGRMRSDEVLNRLLQQYEIAIKINQACALLTVQLAGRFMEMDRQSSELIEYAVGNIAEETFIKPYYVWHSSSSQDHVVILVVLEEGAAADHSSKETMKQLCESLQVKVASYLNGEISIVASDWFKFPDQLPKHYREALTTLYRLQLDEPKLVMLDELSTMQLSSNTALEELHKPPTFINLLEGGQWQAAKDKLDAFFISNEQHTRERMYEAFIAISNGFIYVANKMGVDLHSFDSQGTNLLLDRSVLLTASHLRAWSYEMLELLSIQYDESDTYHKKHIIKQVQELVSKELGGDTSVKTIADRVFLHPVYLSKLYKHETGESLGDYIIRIRMEKAVYMLKHTNKKIYEITTELGYQNPQYFSKIFRKYYGCTPNEFRDQ